jgi:integrase
MNHRKYLNDEEFGVLFSKIRSDVSRDSTIIGLILVTGGRASEILNLRVRDVDFHGCVVLLRGLKGSFDREMPVQGWLLERILGEVMRSELSQDALVFDITYRRLYDIWLKFRNVEKGLHSLRHTFAVRLYRRSKDLLLVQGSLGHKDIKNTMVYQAAINSVDERKLFLE